MVVYLGVRMGNCNLLWYRGLEGLTMNYYKLLCSLDYNLVKKIAADHERVMKLPGISEDRRYLEREQWMDAADALSTISMREGFDYS